MASNVTTEKKVYTFKPETLASCINVPLKQIDEFTPIYPETLRYIDAATMNFGIWIKGTANILEYISPALATEAKTARLTEIVDAISRVQTIATLCVRVTDRDKFFEHTKSRREALIQGSEIISKHPESVKAYLAIADCSSQVMSFIDKKTVEYAEQVATDVTLKINQIEDMVDMLVDIVQFKQSFYDHVSFVTLISAALGKKLGLGDQHIKSITLGCLYHDVGITRLDLPDFYTARLPPKLQREYERHPSVGVDYLNEFQAKGISLPEDVYKIVLQHHESFNGSGFPNGRKGRLSKENPNGINVLAMIVAIADKFSLYFEQKEGKVKMDPRLALQAINRLEGDFDPVVLKAFNDMLVSVKANPVQVGKVKYTF